jgi:hypothetical protein
MKLLGRLGIVAVSLIAIVPDMGAQSAVSAETRRTVVDSLARSLERLYVFPEVGSQMAADLRGRLKRGEYNAVSNGAAFAEALTGHMRAISHDKHLHVSWRDDAHAFTGDHAAPSGAERAQQDAFLRRVNYGFARVERLPGNVGYLDLRGFVDPEVGRETAVAALRFLGNADALIVDLRRNGGGEPGMVALISSILFPRGKRVHLNDLYWREGNRVDEYYTDPDLDLPRMLGPVYVLTSGNTFSAAEEFTYNLKQLKRAIQVGETTGGGANPGEGLRLSSNFGVFVPTGRAVNPISHDNWEGKGAVPEIAVAAKDALRTAHLKAIEAVREQTTDPDWRESLGHALERVRNAPPEPWEGD